LSFSFSFTESCRFGTLDPGIKSGNFHDMQTTHTHFRVGLQQVTTLRIVTYRLKNLDIRVTCETTTPKRLARPFFNDPSGPIEGGLRRLCKGPGDPHALANGISSSGQYFQHGLCNVTQIWPSGIPLRDFAHGHAQCTNSYAIPRSWRCPGPERNKLKGDYRINRANALEGRTGCSSDRGPCCRNACTAWHAR
jgi:hypothetical protein